MIIVGISWYTGGDIISTMGEVGGSVSWGTSSFVLFEYCGGIS